MRRDSLLEFFRDYIDADARRDAAFVLHDDGYRARTWTYGEIARASRAFAARLSTAGLGPGDKLVLWGENRGEWIAALWGALLAEVVAVPVDFRASAGQAHRIREIVEARIMLVGDEVSPEAAPDFAIWRMSDEGLFAAEARGSSPAASAAGPGAGSQATRLAEIIFTSGATSDPKGVTLTHRNILANIHPIEEELGRYRPYLRLLHPIRFLNLLPLSHMFGQSMATFMPPLVGGTVVFTSGYNPQEIVRQIKSRRVAALVCVPKVLDVLRDHVQQVAGSGRPPVPPDRHWLRRAWARRDVHRLFGWRFWCIVVGGAPLDAQLEAYWSGLGFMVIQGYGLTETAPIVTLNHPFKKAAAGSVGTAISGVEIRIADDGEILVRGDNVTAGYYGAPGGTDAAFQNGWFHTGDVGALDGQGRLTIRGRKKEMIVTPQGLNVFPEDVERALGAQPGVIESAAIGLQQDGEERVHAVLVAAAGASPESIVRGANATLEDHQRIRSWSLWTADALPRTEGTRKLKRKEVQRWAQSAHGAVPGSTTGAAPGRTVEELVTAAADGRAVTRETTFEELGLPSLDRVQLLTAIEGTFQISIDEAEFAAAATVGDLADLTARQSAPASPPPAGAQRTGRTGPPPRDIQFPRWNRMLWARATRRVSLPTWVLAISRVWMDLEVEGLEHLEGLEHPVVFAPNHQSHMDTPALLQALPPKWRYRVAPAMAKEWFKPHFFPEKYSMRERLRNSLSYYLASLFYNCFPIPQYEGGARQTIRYIGTLFEERHSLLIYPEGKRTDYGEIAEFRPGIGLIASRLGVPVVPVRIEGLDRVLGVRASWPVRGAARITFGKPMRLAGNDYRALASQVRDAVVSLQPYSGPDPGSVA
ncbi:MAG: AMP-binding protein [Acidobacteriota bacterium]|nr:AMP-binding protein [Acidobacteriota bacterium]